MGNPPFLGGKRISTAHGDGYRDWLATLHADASSNTDLIAHFFRRAFVLLRHGGTFGLIATNTIAQGDTRAGGLRWICTNGGAIYSARKRLKWPAPGAAVTVSVVHVARSATSHAGRVVSEGWPPEPLLDGQRVVRISAFLFEGSSDEDPRPIAANAGLCFGGYKLAGQGFLFADQLSGATPLEAMRRLLADDPGSGQLIQPYIGGDELNTSPTLAPERWAVNFGRMSLDEAQRWPQLLALVEAKVKPERDRANRDAHRLRWWQFGETRPGLTEAIAGLSRILACASISTHLAWAWLAPRILPSHNLSVVVLDTNAAFAVLQSRPHELFAAFFSSTLEDRQGYRPSDCFEPFPFPGGWESSGALEAAGRDYYDLRSALMIRNKEGLTRTYNRFHDPDEQDPDILNLREVHDAMDRVVLDAYGWTDIQPKCEFLLDYEEEEEGEDDGGKKKPKKKPWRYRWPDEIRDDILARLLALNRKRAEEEALAGRSAASPPGRAARSSAR